MISEERIKRIEAEAEAQAEAQAREIVAALGLDRLDKFDNDLAQLKANTDALKKQVDVIAVMSGLHPRIKLASGFSRRTDIVKELNSGAMIGRFNERNWK